MGAYRAGIIGTGGIAGMGILGLHDRDNIGRKKFHASHAGGYLDADNITLVAAADTNEEKLYRFGDAWDLPVDRRYVGHEEMLAAEDLDVVSVCTPSYLHRDHVMAAARSSADPDAIWCEKPIATSVTGVEEMLSTCEETDTDLVINHSFRFTDPMQQLRAALDDGLIGEIRAVNARFRRELMRNSTHLLDLLVFLLDARPTTVSGYLNGENDAVEVLEAGQTVDDSGGGGMVILEDDTFVTIDCTVAREISSMELSFIGTEGKLYLNNDDEEWRYWDLEDGNHVERPLPGIDGTWSWEEDYPTSFTNAVTHIIDLIEGQAQNLSPGVEAGRSLEMIVGFYVSHSTGARVSIPLDRPLRDVTITSW